MPLYLLNQNYKTRKLDSIEWDAVLRETHDMTTRVTQYPVEDGSTISDHIVNDPEKLTIEGMISNNPIQFIASTIKDVITGAAGTNRAQVTFDALMDLRDKKQPLTVVTGFKTYTSMVITRVSVPVEARTANTLQCTIDLQKFKLVSSSTVSLDMIKSAAKAIAAAKTNAASQTPKGADSPEKTWARILLESAIGGLKQ